MKALTFILLLWPLCFYAQYWPAPSAESYALGGISTTAITSMPIGQNPALNGKLLASTMGMSAQNRFGLAELNSFSAQFSQKMKHSGLGFGLDRFGYQLYNQLRFSTAYGLSLSRMISVGIAMNYHITQVAEKPKQSNDFAIAGGLFIQASETVALGMELSNIGLTNLSNPQSVGTKYKVGASYKLAKTITVFGEIQSQLKRLHSYHFSLCYQPIPALFLTYSIRTAAFTNAFGIGFKIKKYRLDLSMQQQAPVGLSPAASICYQFGAP